MKINDIRLTRSENGCNIHISGMDGEEGMESYYEKKYNADAELYNSVIAYIEGLDPEMEAPKETLEIPNRRPYRRMR